MKITLITVGKIKEKFFQDAIAEYSKRLSRYCKLEIIQVADEKTPDKASEAEELQIKDKEGKRILEQIKDTLAKEGYELDIVIFDDYILPNKSLADGELDANYFQHTPYLNNFNKENGTDLAAAFDMHYEPFGIYAGKTASIEELKDGASIAIPNDGSNETRALLLLAQEGLITLPEDASAEKGVSHLDIVDAKGYNVVPVQADMVPTQLANSDAGTLAVINGNYAMEAGFSVGKDALATEDASSEAAQTYANVLVVKEGNENDPAIQALYAALTSDKVKDYINSTYDGAVVPIF